MTSKSRHRRKRHFRRHTPPGASPGTIRVDPAAPSPVITLIAYDREGFEERPVCQLEDIPAALQRWNVVWINVGGLGDAQVIESLGKIFGLHPLALEDVVHVHQRPKVEQYGEHLFAVARMPSLENGLELEQLSLFLGPNFVLTFLEDPGDCLDPVRQRLRGGLGRSRSLRADYLAYAILDAVVDAYFPILEEFSDQMDALEDAVLMRPTTLAISRVHDLKRDLRSLRRAVWPLREATNSLVRDHSPLITDQTRIFLRDCYDHTVQIIDLVETYRELASDLTDLYLSSVSHRMNEIMKVLTIIATVFMPLTFIVGVYGMNFDTSASRWNMPELKWPWGYPLVWGLMAMVTVAMLFFFRRRGWIGPPKPVPASAHPHGHSVALDELVYPPQHEAGR